MERPDFNTDKVALGDNSMNMVETPEDSPERMRESERMEEAADKEMGGRFNHMAQNYEALSRSVHQLKMDRHNSDMMSGQPKVVEIELGYEERKRNNRFRQSTLSEHLRINQHPLADSPTIKNSLTDWISTFKNLPRYPANISEFVTSGSLYFIMEEIESDFFKEFPYKDLNKQEAKSKQEPKTLKKVYKHMLSQMELWFNANNDASNSMRVFKTDIIDLKRLIE